MHSTEPVVPMVSLWLPPRIRRWARPSSLLMPNGAAIAVALRLMIWFQIPVNIMRHTISHCIITIPMARVCQLMQLIWLPIMRLVVLQKRADWVISATMCLRDSISLAIMESWILMPHWAIKSLITERTIRLVRTTGSRRLTETPSDRSIIWMWMVETTVPSSMLHWAIWITLVSHMALSLSDILHAWRLPIRQMNGWRWVVT